MTDEITFEISTTLHSKMKDIAKKLDMSIDEIIEEALLEYVHIQELELQVEED